MIKIIANVFPVDCLITHCFSSKIKTCFKGWGEFFTSPQVGVYVWITSCSCRFTDVRRPTVSYRTDSVFKVKLLTGTVTNSMYEGMWERWWSPLRWWRTRPLALPAQQSSVRPQTGRAPRHQRLSGAPICQETLRRKRTEERKKSAEVTERKNLIWKVEPVLF